MLKKSILEWQEIDSESSVDKEAWELTIDKI